MTLWSKINVFLFNKDTTGKFNRPGGIFVISKMGETKK